MNYCLQAGGWREKVDPESGQMEGNKIEILPVYIGTYQTHMIPSN